MIIVQLSGGLGNQMFQYALARNLAERNLTILKFDIISSIENDNIRKFALNCFHINDQFALPEEVYIFNNRNRKAFRIANRIFNKVSLALGSTCFINSRYYEDCIVVEEKHFAQFDPGVLDIRGNIYLKGFWQSEKYFSDIKDIIINEFKIIYPQNKYSQEISNKIAKTNSVSVHFRRGDYIDYNYSYGADYYLKAIDFITDQIVEPHFFLFSDDPKWLYENFKINYPSTIVYHSDGHNDYEDLRLISLCKHHIIANSTFSWWGAWLAQYHGKIVIAPKQHKWLADKCIYSYDLYPRKWNLL